MGYQTSSTWAPQEEAAHGVECAAGPALYQPHPQYQKKQ
jgi:hypothetical protein